MGRGGCVTTQSKKNGERHIIDRYLNFEGDRQPTAIVAGERPDFIIRFGQLDVGIEVTEYHSSQRQRQVNEAWKSLQSTAYGRDDFPDRRNVKLHFSKHSVPPRKHHKKFIDQVFGLTASVPPGRELSLHRDHLPPLIARYVDRIEISPAQCRIAWGWNFDRAWVGVRNGELEEIIERKAASFERCCQERWLIIAGGSDLSTLMALHTSLEMMPNLGTFLLRSALDRLILIDSCVVEWRRNEGWRQLA